MEKTNTQNIEKTYVTPEVEEINLITAPTLTGTISQMNEEEG